MLIKINISDDIEIKISLSIGVSFYPKDGDNIDDLILKADKAMYCVKNRVEMSVFIILQDR